MISSFPRLLLAATVAAGLLGGLGACGKKGSPRPPEGLESEYTSPQPYPAPETVTPNGTGSADEAGPLSIFRGENRTRTKTY